MATIKTITCICGCANTFRSSNPKRVFLNTACQVRHYRKLKKQQEVA